MRVSITDIESELNDACRRVCLDAGQRVELVNTVMNRVTEAINEGSDPVSKLRAAFEMEEVQQQFNDTGIVDYTVQENKHFTIGFNRKFKASDFHPDLVLSGRMCVLGRLASRVAEEALDGRSVAVLHAEDIVITGNEESTIKEYREKRKSGGSGPYYPKQPDRIAKRSVRGMLPYKKKRGREALERIRMYLGAPAPFDGEAKVPEGKRVTLNPYKNKDYTSLRKVSNHL